MRNNLILLPATNPADPGFTRQTRVAFGFERGRLEVVAEAAPKARRAGNAGKGRR